jgi:hypothetical protein
MNILKIISAAFLALAVGTVNAAVVYDNGGPNQSNGVLVVPPITQLDDFSLSTETLITDGHFWTLETVGNSAWDGTLQYGFYTSSGNQAAPISGFITLNLGVNVTKDFVQEVTIGQTSYNEYYYSFDLASALDLLPGDYLFGIYLGDNSSNIFWEATDSTSGINSVFFFSDGSIPGFFPNDFDVAYQLTGRIIGIPVPSSLMLLIGLLAPMLMKRRRTC